MNNKNYNASDQTKYPIIIQTMANNNTDCEAAAARSKNMHKYINHRIENYSKKDVALIQYFINIVVNKQRFL